MKPAGKAAVVLAGYAAALLAAWGAWAVRRSSAGPGADASAGMYAFGDATVFFGVLFVAGAVPTLLALRWLRSVAWFWAALAIVGLALAASGVFAAAWLELDRLRPYVPPRTADGRPVDPARLRASYYCFTWLFTTPLVALGSGLAARFAPPGRSRRGLDAAALVALAVLVFSLVRTFSRTHD